MRTVASFAFVFALACDANVVDAVREPVPLAPSGGSTAGGTGGGATGGEGGSPPSESPLGVSILHRYSFTGEGDVALDSRGAAHGQVVATTLAGDGTLPLAGLRSGQYLNLPNHIVSGLTDATFEVWLTWEGGSGWQRIFDFGSNSAGEDTPGPTGISYLFLAASTPPDTARQLPAMMRLTYSQNGVEDEEVCDAPGPLPTFALTHVAVVISRERGTAALYQDGALLVECRMSRPLSAINDVNNWLGHSNFEADVDLTGRYDEFRIYDAALGASEIAASFAAGPNAEP